MGCCSSCCKCCRNDTRVSEDVPQAPPSKATRRSVLTSMRGYDFGYDKGYQKSGSEGSDNADTASSRATDPIFIGIFEYQPGNKATAELSVKEGDQFRLAGNPEAEIDAEWLFVMRIQHVENRRWNGYVPKAFVAPETSLDVFPWYFGQLSGEESELLLNPLPDSSFLVRKRPIPASPTGRKMASRAESVKYSAVVKVKDRSDYVLCVKRAGKISHHPIYLNEEMHTVFITKGNNYASISELIEGLRENATANPPGGQLKGWPKKKPPDQLQLSHASQRNWREIPRTQIILGEKKGDGHFGIVHAGTWNTPDGRRIPIAVKTLKNSSIREKQRFLQEAATMKNLTHKHLVRLFGIVSDKEPFWLITEYIKDGSLLLYLRKRKQQNNLVPEKTLINVCLQICDGMRYLESKKVVHRDLAARNILVAEEKPGQNPQLLAKIADFGMAQLVQPANRERDKKDDKMDIPTKWTAPEALDRKEYSSASDVWSFAVVVHEIFSHGQEPYGILLHNAVRNHVVKNRQFLRQHSSVPDKLYAIMTRCFRYEPNERPSFKELYTIFYSYYRKPGESSIKGR